MENGCTCVAVYLPFDHNNICLIRKTPGGSKPVAFAYTYHYIGFGTYHDLYNDTLFSEGVRQLAAQII